jgi:hypothetical protein
MTPQASARSVAIDPGDVTFAQAEDPKALDCWKRARRFRSIRA